MLGAVASAQVKTEVKEFNLAGPFAVNAPLSVDTVNVKGEKFDEKSLLQSLALTTQPTTTFSGQVLPSLKDSKSVGLPQGQQERGPADVLSEQQRLSQR